MAKSNAERQRAFRARRTVKADRKALALAAGEPVPADPLPMAEARSRALAWIEEQDSSPLARLAALAASDTVKLGAQLGIDAGTLLRLQVSAGQAVLPYLHIPKATAPLDAPAGGPLITITLSPGVAAALRGSGTTIDGFADEPTPGG